MLKIICDVTFDPAKDAGAIRGDMEIVKQWCARSPELRPCGLLHGWVEKQRTCVKCAHCKQAIEK